MEFRPSKVTVVLFIGALVVAGGCLCGGDSLVDSGNNNYLNSIAKANYIPYGVDFYLGPTGRFSMGKTFIDFLPEVLDIAQPENYINTSGDLNILKGVNKLCCSRCRDSRRNWSSTRKQTFSQVSMFIHHKKWLLSRGMKEADMYQLLGDAFVVMVLGSNDYLNNYLLPTLYATSSLYNPQDYANLLLNHYARQIEGLRLSIKVCCGIGRNNGKMTCLQRRVCVL